jgi:hypothetical protein
MKREQAFWTLDSLPWRSLQEILQQGAGSSDAPSRGADATSKHTVVVSAKVREEPVARNLPEVTSMTSRERESQQF